MKNTLQIISVIILYITLNSHINGQVQKTYGWYKITKCDNEKLWNVGSQFQFLATDPSRVSDSVLLSGFTNNGTAAIGTIKDGKLKFEMQRKTLSPFGSNGKIIWNLEFNASGEWKNGTITLSYSFRQDTFPVEKGNISADFFLPDFANQSNVNDTVINGKWYQYALYDLNRHANFIGEIYTNNIKNGHWLFFDHHGLLMQSSQFKNDTLNGQSDFYTNTESKPRYKHSGLMVNGKKIGEFFSYEYQGKKWKKIGSELYDANGQRICSNILYPNGKLMFQTFYSPEGKAIWYRGYYKNGKLYKDDDVQNMMVEIIAN